VVWLLLCSYYDLRGARLVACPESKQLAAVDVNALRAAAARLVGRQAFRLHDCSGWPERAGCRQGCLRQIEAAPSDCLVRVMLQDWYADKSCPYCLKPLGNIHWPEHKLALRTPEGKTIEWHEVRVEDIPAALATHQAVCWECHITQTFGRLDPDLIAQRLGQPEREPARDTPPQLNTVPGPARACRPSSTCQSRA
jgi:hypothetical protein